MRRGIHQSLRIRFLGGLPTLAIALSLSSVGCDKNENKAPTATAERSQAVAATGAYAPTAAASTVSAPVVSAPVKKPPRKLCAGELDKPGRPFPEKSPGRANAPGAPAMPAKMALGSGWTWVNFWAAWCVPCKEEMPRLRGWEKKLVSSGKKFHLVFVSLDDDERQLDDFLKAQPEGGTRSSYWLKEGKPRESWLEAAGIEEDPELPTHLLVDPSGKIRCRVKGAVEDSDFDSVAEIVSH
jgi:thiol-disulfide isomerase/thioredoxin